LELKFTVQGKIRKPVGEVFDAVYDPKKLSAYFTNGGATGPLKEGTSVTWSFAEFPGTFPVRVKKVVKNETISFEWALPGSEMVPVEFNFTSTENQQTLVKIFCSGFRDTQKSLDESYSYCSGWMQMLCSLKVYAEEGKNLREVFF
jgi:uncharacterized protein YndB with AHSA1/START domain